MASAANKPAEASTEAEAEAEAEAKMKDKKIAFGQALLNTTSYALLRYLCLEEDVDRFPKHEACILEAARQEPLRSTELDEGPLRRMCKLGELRHLTTQAWQRALPTHSHTSNSTLSAASLLSAQIREHACALPIQLHQNAGITVRERAFFIALGVPFDRSLMDRLLSVASVSESEPYLFERIMNTLCTGSTQHSDLGARYGTPVPQLVRAALTQDDELFQHMWTLLLAWFSVAEELSAAEVSKLATQSGVVLRVNAKPALTLLGNVCAQHGTHFQTSLVARSCSRYASTPCLYLFVERYTAHCFEHQRLADELLTLRLVSPEALIAHAVKVLSMERFAPVAAVDAALQMASVLITLCVNSARKGYTNQSRGGISFAHWLASRTVVPGVELIVDLGVLRKLARVWQKVSATATATATATLPPDGCLVCLGARLGCGALLQIGMRIRRLNASLHSRRTLLAFTQPAWLFACKQATRQPCDATLIWQNILHAMWQVVQHAPWSIFKSADRTSKKLRAQLSHSVVGILMHWRLYALLCPPPPPPPRTLSSLDTTIVICDAIGGRGGGGGGLLDIALCKVAIKDDQLETLHRFFHYASCTADVPTPSLPATWLLTVALQAPHVDLAGLMPLLEQGAETMSARDSLFCSAMGRGLPRLAAVTFPTSTRELVHLFAHLASRQRRASAFHRTCWSTCVRGVKRLQGGETRCLLINNIDGNTAAAAAAAAAAAKTTTNQLTKLDTQITQTTQLYEALAQDNGHRFGALLNEWPPLAIQPIPPATWKKLCARLHPWCARQCACDAYQLLPQNIFVAAVRLRRVACTERLLASNSEWLPVCDTLRRDRLGHSIFCEALWLSNAFACTALQRYHELHAEPGAISEGKVCKEQWSTPLAWCRSECTLKVGCATATATATATDTGPS
jgi:hypothetical protein